MAMLVSNNISPVYELPLNPAEPHHINDTIGVFAFSGAGLKVRCQLAGGPSDAFNASSLALRRNGEVVTELVRDTLSATMVIDSFDASNDVGLYECSASRSDGRTHSRKLRMRHSPHLPPGHAPCDGPESCSNGGVCAKTKDGYAICVCPENYIGAHCEHVLIKDFIVTGTKVGVAAGGVVNLILIFFCVLLAFLFIKERKSRRRWEGVAACTRSLSTFRDAQIEAAYELPKTINGEGKKEAEGPARRLLLENEPAIPRPVGVDVRAPYIDRSNAIKGRINGAPHAVGETAPDPAFIGSITRR